MNKVMLHLPARNLSGYPNTQRCKRRFLTHVRLGRSRTVRCRQPRPGDRPRPRGDTAPGTGRQASRSWRTFSEHRGTPNRLGKEHVPLAILDLSRGGREPMTGGEAAGTHLLLAERRKTDILLLVLNLSC